LARTAKYSPSHPRTGLRRPYVVKSKDKGLKPELFSSGTGTITFSIGTASRDYATMTLWEADLDNSVYYSNGDTAVGECYNDSDFNETLTINGGVTVGLAGITLQAATGEKHDGTANTGVRNRLTSGPGSSVFTFGNTAWGANADVILRNIEFDYNSQTQTSGATVISIDANAANSTETRQVLGCIIHDVVSANGNGWDSFIAKNDNVGLEIHNNICYDLNNATITSDSMYGFRSVATTTNGGTVNIQNNTFHNLNYTNASATGDVHGIHINRTSGTWNIQNNLVTTVTNSGSGGADCYETTGAITEEYNASSDATATGTGAVPSITTANQYVSTTGGSEDLHLKTGADCLEAGTNLNANFTDDAQGATRPGAAANRAWDIGALQGGATITKTIGTTGRNYTTMVLFEADLDDTNEFSNRDDVIGDCYADSDFTAKTDFVTSGETIGLNTITLQAATGERHDGTANTGVRILSTAQKVLLLNTDTTSKIIGIEIDSNSSAGNNLSGSIHSDVDVNNSSNLIDKCIVHNVDNKFGANGIKITRGGTIRNTIVYDIKNGDGTFNDRQCYGILVATRTYTIHNCTVHDVKAVTATGFTVKGIARSNATVTATNTVVTDVDYDVGAEECFAASIGGSHQASSDATASGTGSLTSITTADQYVSTTGGSEDLHLKTGADCLEAGTNLNATFTDDSQGATRPGAAANRAWDIGALQGGATITYSVGTTGRNYSTWTLWEADLNDTDEYSNRDDAVGEGYNDSALSQSNFVVNGGGTIGLGSVKMTVAAGERHEGVAGTGMELTLTSGGQVAQMGPNTPGNITWEWFELKCTATNVTICIQSNGGGTTVNTIRNFILHGLRSTGGIGFCVGIETRNGTHVHHNILMYDMECISDTQNLHGYDYNFGASTEVYNMTIHNIHQDSGSATANVYGLQAKSDVDFVAKNVVVTDATNAGSGSALCFDGIGGNGTYTYLASSDTTAINTGAVPSITTANQYISTTEGSEDLHIKNTAADIYETGVDLGTTPTGVQFDIDNYDRDTGGVTWSIGADQGENAPELDSPTFLRFINYNKGYNFRKYEIHKFQ
jgi:hypothetical protein